MNLTFLIMCSLFFASSLMAYPKVYTGADIRNDKAVSLTLAGSKYTVAYFLNSKCPCSQSHFDHLNELQKKYKSFSFVGFHSNKAISKEDAAKYFAKFKINFPILMDKDLKIANAFQAVKTPHIFVIDSKGQLLFQGGATNSRNPKRAKHFYLRDALSALAAGKDVQVKNARTIGCYIQR